MPMSIRACWNSRRSGCSPCAPRPASMASRCRICRNCWIRWPRGWRRWKPARPRSRRWSRRHAIPKTVTSPRPRRCRRARTAAAGKLQKAVGKELPPLRLDKARFFAEVSPLPEAGWGPNGMDQVRFLIATNPGQEPGPLARVASGGELSRLMLAMKVVLSAGSAVPTLVFDEVDSGIGGATAAAVGERLVRVAEGVQVLVVTHSPQVAARGAWPSAGRQGGRPRPDRDHRGSSGAGRPPRGNRPDAGRRDRFGCGPRRRGRSAARAEAAAGAAGMTWTQRLVAQSAECACPHRGGSRAKNSPVWRRRSRITTPPTTPMTRRRSPTPITMPSAAAMPRSRRASQR